MLSHEDFVEVCTTMNLTSELTLTEFCGDRFCLYWSDETIGLWFEEDIELRTNPKTKSALGFMIVALVLLETYIVK